MATFYRLDPRSPYMQMLLLLPGFPTIPGRVGWGGGDAQQEDYLPPHP